jgi:hypothetical protein
MANTDRRRSDAVHATSIQNRRRIPTDPSGPQYADDLGRYLDQLLDAALEETFPASDALAVPTRRDIEKK